MNNKQPTILVTGSNGQLGSALQLLSQAYPGYRFLFTTKEELDILHPVETEEYFSERSIDYCINCAAYTAVDKAETEKENAFFLNGYAVACIADICNKNGIQLIHISTDYVFDGEASQRYKETDKTNPVSVYGKSKLHGEELALRNAPSAIIIRTSWLYSSFKNNFVKTMLRLMKEKESIHVVNDQYGSPTYAGNLAAAIMQIIASGKSQQNPGIYHYANAGVTTWYEFAVAIKKITGSKCIVNPITTAAYPTAAKRPAYSVLDTTKIKEVFGVSVPGWEESLKKCLEIIS
ncbi:MAG: dTDP-4-dehydrorhamnose reductase [Ferruginibacter sp.]|nr:dTDP-4-dehydrorhamnose reductase [Ferruginibacter sp.]